MQTIANDQNKRSNTVQDLKNFSSQTLATPAKKGEQFFSRFLLLKKLLIDWAMIWLKYLQKMNL